MSALAEECNRFKRQRDELLIVAKMARNYILKSPNWGWAQSLDQVRSDLYQITVAIKNTEEDK